MDPKSLQLLGLPMLAWVALLPLLVALFNLTLGRRISKATAHTLAVGMVLLRCALSIYLVALPLWKQFKAGAGGADNEQTGYTWIEAGGFKAQLAFRLDT